MTQMKLFSAGAIRSGIRKGENNSSKRVLVEVGLPSKYRRNSKVTDAATPCDGQPYGASRLRFHHSKNKRYRIMRFSENIKSGDTLQVRLLVRLKATLAYELR
jgi:hypothetical protein